MFLQRPNVHALHLSPRQQRQIKAGRWGEDGGGQLHWPWPYIMLFIQLVLELTHMPTSRLIIQIHDHTTTRASSHSNRSTQKMPGRGRQPKVDQTLCTHIHALEWTAKSPREPFWALGASQFSPYYPKPGPAMDIDRSSDRTFVPNPKCWSAHASGGGGWERTCLMTQTTRPGGQKTVTNLRQGRGRRGLEKIQPWQEGERSIDMLISEGQPV